MNPGRKPVDESDQQEQPFEVALFAVAPLHAQGVTEHRREKPDGQKLQQRPKREPQQGVDHAKVHQIEQISAHRVVEVHASAGGVPVSVQFGSGARPLVFGDLQGGIPTARPSGRTARPVRESFRRAATGRCLPGPRKGRRPPTSGARGQKRCTPAGFRGVDLTCRCAPSTASRTAVRSSADPRIAAARYWNVVRARFHGCFRRFPESTLLSTTPWPTSGNDNCMITLAAPAPNARSPSLPRS